MFEPMNRYVIKNLHRCRHIDCGKPPNARVVDQLTNQSLGDYCEPHAVTVANRANRLEKRHLQPSP